MSERSASNKGYEMEVLIILLLLTSTAAAQQISVFNGPNGPVATELSYPTENFYYLGNDVISAPKIGNYTVYNGPNGELLGSRVDGIADQ